MKQNSKLILAIALTAIITSISISYLTWKSALSALATGVNEMETMNAISRVESWDHMEKLLVKGCNKEALKFIKIERHSEFSTIKSNINDNAQLMSKAKERSFDIISRVSNASKYVGSTIPTCK